MNIYVCDEVKYLSKELVNRGYKLINKNDNIKCDAIICDLKNTSLMNLMKMNNNIKTEGSLIIDSSSKTIDEIEYIISSRAYSRII